MSLVRLRWRVLIVAAAGAVGLMACAEVFGFKPGEYDPDGGVDASADTPPDYVTHDVFTVDVNTALCDGAVPAVDAAVWVSNTVTGAADSPLCGGPSTPCLTIAQGLLRAAAIPVTTVYVDNSTFVEAVTMSGTNYRGFTIQGGWIFDAGVWTPNCVSSLSKIYVPDGGDFKTVTITNVGSPGVTLRLLEIHSKDPGTTPYGESRYAVVVANSNLLLDNVTLIAQSANPGQYGNSGDSPNGCLYSGGSGMNGAAGQVGDAGSFTMTGFAPASGGPGDNGDQGVSPFGNAGQCDNNCVVLCGP